MTHTTLDIERRPSGISHFTHLDQRRATREYRFVPSTDDYRMTDVRHCYRLMRSRGFGKHEARVTVTKLLGAGQFSTLVAHGE